jgi:HEAT repeat protein
MSSTIYCRLIALFAFAFTASCFAQQDEFGGKKKDEWIKMLQNEKNPQTRQRVVKVMMILGPTQKDIAQALAVALREDPEAIVRQEVVGVVANLKKEEMRDWVPRLADALKYDKSPAVRSGAAAVLGKLGDLAKPVLSNLAAGLKDNDAATRAACAQALGRIGEDAKESVPDLAKLLADKDLTVRLAAAFALGRVGPDGAAAVKELSATLTADTAPDVRKEAARTIGLLGPDAKPAIPALVKAVQEDKDAEIRQQAVLSLGKMGGEIRESLAPLKEALKKDKDKTVRLFIVRTLPEALGADAKELVKDFADHLNNDPDGDVRLAIVQELAAIGPDAKEAIPALREAERDIQVQVRSAATAAIRKILAK